MATRTLSNIKLLQTLRGFDKPYFTVADFEKILDQERSSLYVTLNRLVNAGVLARLKRDVYLPEFKSMETDRIANELYYPSYLSFESALSKYGILSQIPYTLTFATTKGSKKLTLADKEIEYRQLKKDYFFGFVLENSVYIAEPEKAVLDQLYIISKGGAKSNIEEWSLVGLSKVKFLKYSKKFPRVVQNKAKKLIKDFGKQVVGLR